MLLSKTINKDSLCVKKIDTHIIPNEERSGNSQKKYTESEIETDFFLLLFFFLLLGDFFETVIFDDF